jgi:hypothetical protein
MNVLFLPHLRERRSSATRVSHHRIVASASLGALALALLGEVVWVVVAAPAIAAAASPPRAISVVSPGGLPDACAPGNLVSFAHPLVVRANQWICGDVDAYGGEVQVLGHVGGSVTVFGGSVRIIGEVDGNVTVFGGDIDFAPHARVSGDVRTWGGTIHHASVALIYGNVERSDRLASTYGSRWPWVAGPWTFPWPWILGWTVLAAIVVTLFPERTMRVAMVARRAVVRSLIVGLLTAILGLGLIAILFATCVGIPISLLVMAGLLAGWVLGTVAMGLWLGEHLVPALAPRGQSPLLPAVVGMALLAAVESLPAIGAAIAVIASSVGLGATLLSRFGARRSGLSVPVSVPPLS